MVPIPPKEQKNALPVEEPPLAVPPPVPAPREHGEHPVKTWTPSKLAHPLRTMILVMAWRLKNVLLDVLNPDELSQQRQKILPKFAPLAVSELVTMLPQPPTPKNDVPDDLAQKLPDAAKRVNEVKQQVELIGRFAASDVEDPLKQRLKGMIDPNQKFPEKIALNVRNAVLDHRVVSAALNGQSDRRGQTELIERNEWQNENHGIPTKNEVRGNPVA